jgi:hypothetical protein
MSSLRRVQSSKANGALSKGPVTPAGKQRSSLNALRHGMCAKCIVNAERMAGAFYETRQHLMYQGAMRTLIMLRTVKAPNDPSPISERPPSPQATDSEPPCGAANSGCSRLSAGYRASTDLAAPATSRAPAATPNHPGSAA